MAITNAQQFRQMYQFGGGADAGGKGSPGGGTFGGAKDFGGGGDNTRTRIQDERQRDFQQQQLRELSKRQAEDKAEEAVEVFRSRNRGGVSNKVLDFLPGIGGIRRIASTFGPLNTRDFLLDKVLDAGRYTYKGPNTQLAKKLGFGPVTLDKFANLTEEEKEDVLDSYQSQRGLNEIDAYGNPIGDGGGDGQQFMFPQRLQASAPSITKQEEETFNPNFRLLAEGGRAGFQEGGGIEQRLEKLGGDVTSAEKMLQGINKRLETAESSLGSGGGIGSLPAGIANNMMLPQPSLGVFANGKLPTPIEFDNNRPGPFMSRPLFDMRPLNATLPATLEAVQPLAGSPIQEPTILQPSVQTPAVSQPPANFQPNNITPEFGLNTGGGLFDGRKDFTSLEDAFKFAQKNAEVLRRGTDFTGPQAPIINPTTGKFVPFAGELSFDDFSKNFSLEDGALVQDPSVKTVAGMGGVPIFNTTTDPTFFGIGAEGLTPQQFTFGGSQDPQQAYLDNIAAINANRGGIPAAGYADGGNVVGGIMDLESARQMYGLGKLVKKVTRTVKKIAKSPIGKAAILGAGTYFGLNQFGATKNLGMLAKLGIAGAVAGLPFLAKQEEEEEPLYAGADIADPRFIMANPQRFQNIRLMAEGGSTEKEPVAKKTMPLLDMGGQEMDLRAEGGFVPIGRMEKADDVPARLSKNEFVFTADAVRNAGDGDVDKGAEVMYNMMKNLEAGGDVSEESQGLEGARRMFQTSQRLEEVL